MHIPGWHRLKSWCKDLRARNFDRFLKGCKGVIHVGANKGQERNLYRHEGLKVIWIEPIPEVFDALQANLQGYPLQIAINALVTENDGAEHDFFVANNSGASSSILPFAQHLDIWPEVAFERTIKLSGVTLDTLLSQHNFDTEDYDVLVMDTQGSELMVMKGAPHLLKRVRYIKIEVPDFEAYRGCCKVPDVEAFLHPLGFREQRRNCFAKSPEGGAYFDILYSRRTR